ncbi:MAG: redoxin domain-containing protein [Akkermansia sp.]|nr:redoxin domain-containing protein [Akkermansia sp.]
MKQLLTLFGTLLLLGGLVAPLHAQEAEDAAAEAETEQAAEEQEPEVISIPDLLKEVEYVTKEKPKKKAYVYYFLRSHSKCGPCQAVIAPLNNLYAEMKNKGAVIIMLNGDADTETAKKWAEEKNISFPMITPDTAGVIGAKVPAGGSGGTPNIMAVMADGEQIEGTSGYSKCPTLVGTWKEMVKDAKKAEARKKADAAKAKKKKGKKKKTKKAKKAKTAAAEDEI